MNWFGFPVTFDPATSLEIVRKISVFELVSLLGLLFALLSLFLSVRANLDQAETRAADFSLKLWDRFRSDDIQSAFLSIEWWEFQYPSGAFNGFASREEEQRIDRLLTLLDDVASLAKRRILRKHDVQRWNYLFVRVFAYEPIQRYVEFLTGFYARNGMETGPHLIGWRWYKDVLTKAPNGTR